MTEKEILVNVKDLLDLEDRAGRWERTAKENWAATVISDFERDEWKGRAIEAARHIHALVRGEPYKPEAGHDAADALAVEIMEKAGLTFED